MVSLNRKNVCAYCDQKNKLTKEHVWPNCFLHRIGRNHAHYSPKSGHVHGSDYLVRDVCTVCNNEHLAELDAYLCLLYDKYFYKPLDAGGEIKFIYDYNLLSRVMLKIAYNTARSAGSEIEPFLKFREYILSGNDCPTGFSLIVEVVSPSYISDQDGNFKKIMPLMYRSALGKLLSPHGKYVLVRVIAINSFFFHLILNKNDSNLEKFNLATEEFLNNVVGTQLVNPTNDLIDLKTSPQDSLSSILPLLIAKRDDYRKFFDKKKQGR